MLEARDRVGGRTLNQSLGSGHVVEVGGQWVGPGQDRILARARALGVRTFKTYVTGDLLFQLPRRADPVHRPDPTAAGGRRR